MTMVGPVSNTISVVRRVLGSRRYRVAFVILVAVFVALLFQLQVSTVPGNSARMQVALFGTYDWLLLSAVSAVNALFIVVQWYTFRSVNPQRRSTAALVGVAAGGLGTSSSVVAAIFGTATCGLCVTALFGFLGANAVVFLVAHRQGITVGAIAVLMLSLVVTARRFTTSCEECTIPIEHV